MGYHSPATDFLYSTTWLLFPLPFLPSIQGAFGSYGMFLQIPYLNYINVDARRVSPSIINPRAGRGLATKGN